MHAFFSVWRGFQPEQAPYVLPADDGVLAEKELGFGEIDASPIGVLELGEIAS